MPKLYGGPSLKPKPLKARTPSLSLALKGVLPGVAQVGQAVRTNPYATILGSTPSSVGSVTPMAASSGAMSAGSYESQLANDPLLQQQLSAINAQGGAYQAQLAAQRQQALAQFGEIPDNLSGALTGNVNADIDQTTRDLAAAATQGGTSTVAQLQRAYQQQQAADYASLAARGLIRSGALGQHTQEDLTAYTQSRADATQRLLDYLTSAYQNYLGLQSQSQSAAAQATNDALARILAQIQAGMYAQQAAPAAPTGGEYNWGETPVEQAPQYGPYQGYLPEDVAGGPQYTSAGGQTYVQTGQGPYGSRPLY